MSCQLVTVKQLKMYYLFYQRFDFGSEMFTRSDFQLRMSVSNLSHT